GPNPLFIIHHQYGFSHVPALSMCLKIPATRPDGSIKDTRKLLIFYRKFKYESTSPGLVVPHPDEAVMVGYDGRNYRQTQPGTVLLGGKIGLEDALLERRLDARSVVRHLQRDDAAGAVQAGARLDARLTGAVAIFSADCRHRVLQQIDQRPLERLAIDRDEGQGGVKVGAKFDLGIGRAEIDRKS